MPHEPRSCTAWSRKGVVVGGDLKRDTTLAEENGGPMMWGRPQVAASASDLGSGAIWEISNKCVIEADSKNIP